MVRACQTSQSSQLYQIPVCCSILESVSFRGGVLPLGEGNQGKVRRHRSMLIDVARIGRFEPRCRLDYTLRYQATHPQIVRVWRPMCTQNQAAIVPGKVVYGHEQEPLFAIMKYGKAT